MEEQERRIELPSAEVDGQAKAASRLLPPLQPEAIIGCRDPSSLEL